MLSALSIRHALFALLAIFSVSSWAGAPLPYRTRNTTPFTVPAPGLLADDLGLGVTPLAVKQLNGSNTLTGNSTRGASVTLNANGSFTYNPNTSAALQALAPGQTITDTFTYTISSPGATLGGTGMAFANVPETANYALVYQLAIPTVNPLYNGGTVPYSVNNAASITYPVRRIAYYLELKTAAGSLEYAYASMDPFTADVGRMGVPTTQSGAFFQARVNNLTVVSNAANVTQGTNLATGNIEFWPSNYGDDNTLPIPNASNDVFDFGDSGANTSGGYGSMQIHNFDIDGAGAGAAGQTVMAFNRWGTGNNNTNCDLGIGNSPSGNPDYTFRTNAGDYTIKNMQVLVLPPVATATVTIIVSNYGVSIANITQNEGNAGSANFPFVATLSQISNDIVTVQYTTANGTAVAPGDYTAVSGSVSIAAGQLTANIPVSVNGDPAFEANETFTVTLSSPTNAVLIPAGSTATGTITNDDPIPLINIGDVTQVEGNAATSTFVFPVTLSSPNAVDITLAVNTANGTATAGADYTAITGGTVTIPANTLSASVNVTVNGETVVEANETFTVTLSNPSGGSLVDGVAIGKILTEEFAADDSFPVRFNEPIAIAARGVLANDFGPDTPATSLIAVLVAPPATGTLVLQPDGSFTYTAPAPAPGFTTTFTYRAQDPMAQMSNIATVTISLQNNAAPVTSPGSVTVLEDVPQAFNFPVTDSTNDRLTIIITRPPALGTLAVVDNTPAPQFTFVPSANVSGSDSFSFSVTDGVFSATGDVSVTITPVNDAPTATSANYEVGLNSFVNALLIGADAADGTAVTFSVVTAPSSGSVTITNVATGAFRYTPNVGFLGLDSFTFRTNDGVLNSTVATATIEAKPAPLFTSVPVVSPNPLLALQLLSGTSAANNGAVSWNWGDGSTSDGATATHTYATTGVFTVVTTITATTGLKTTFSQQVFVGAPLNGGGATPGIVVGGNNPSGASGSGKGKIICNYVKRDKSSYSGSLKGLTLPPTLTQKDLVGQSGILTVGVGSPNAFSVPFTLSAQGRAKSTGLPMMQINVKKGSFSFKTQAGILTELTESLGGTRQFTKSVTPIVLNVPVTIQVGTQIFIVLTFQMKYNQSGSIGKGGL